MTFRDPERARAYIREWRRVNPEITRVANANARAKRYGISGRITSADVRSVLRDAYCVYCGTSGNPSGTRAERLTVDHIIPMSKGGANTRANLQPACGRCNARKHDAERPGWSRLHDACTDCGTTQKRHGAHGKCTACYVRSRYVPVEVTG